MNELVRYNNKMNTIQFTGFSKVHMDLFMAICSKVKQHETDEIIIDTQELKQITHFARGGNRDFFEELDEMTDRLQKINGKHVDKTQGKRKFIKFNLFPTFEYDEQEEKLIVSVHKKFAWLLNEFENYTIFELEEFVKLKSKYSKNLYRILKQWRTVGKYTFHDLNEFRSLLDVPAKYSNKYLMERCVNVAIEELKNLEKSFENLECTPIYASKRGKPLEKLQFTWKPERKVPEQLSGQENFTDTQTFDEYMKAYQGEDKPSAVAIKIAQDIEKGNKKKKAEPKKNSFNDFHQREYTQEELEDLLLTIPK